MLLYDWQRLDTRQPDTDAVLLNPKLRKDFDGKAYSNVLRVFVIYLELPRDSETYFVFVVDEFSEKIEFSEFC